MTACVRFGWKADIRCLRFRLGAFEAEALRHFFCYHAIVIVHLSGLNLQLMVMLTRCDC